MVVANQLTYWYLAYLSSPSSQRRIYRAAARVRAKRIVELGIQSGARACQLLEIARRYHAREEIAYTGIDLFESRPHDMPGVTLKRAHQLLRPLAGKIQLIPGDPFSALARGANAMLASDLIVISADQDDHSLRRAWFYFPRMLHDRTQVFLEESTPTPGQTVFRKLTQAQITDLAESNSDDRRQAA